LKLRQQALVDKADAPLYLTGAESRYLHMPAAAAGVVLEDIVDHLDQPSGIIPDIVNGLPQGRVRREEAVLGVPHAVAAGPDGEELPAVRR
jgi:hypothetical protein